MPRLSGFMPDDSIAGISKNRSTIYETHKTAPFSPKNSANSALFVSFFGFGEKCTIFCIP